MTSSEPWLVLVVVDVSVGWKYGEEQFALSMLRAVGGEVLG